MVIPCDAMVIVVTKQKVTECEIIKTKVGNEMEIFITLTKYNTCQQGEEGKPLQMVYYLISILPSLTIVSIGLAVRVFANGPGDQDSIPG